MGVLSMSLSYKLDTTNYPWWDDMALWLGNADDSQGYMAGELVGGVTEKWMGGGFLGGQGQAPTGEYIFRDGYYHNGIYILVGSYRAYFSQLKATGAPGYAWDGFILFHRGYNVTTSADGAFLPPMDYTIYPMCWPTICDATNAALLNDDGVGTGLYGVTPLKNQEDLTVATPGLGQENLNICVTGYHVAPPTVQPTDAQTVGSAAQITCTFNGVDALGALYLWDEKKSILLGYDYDQSMLLPTQQLVYRDWKDVIALGDTNLFGATPYERVLWQFGCKPNGTNPDPLGPTSSDNGILNNGYLPTKMFGIRSVSGVTYGAAAIPNINGVVYITGEMASSDNAKKVETLSPFYISMEMSPKVLDGIYDGIGPLAWLGPWCVGVSALSSTLIPGITTPYDSGLGYAQPGFLAADTTGGTTPSTNTGAMEGAAGLDILPPAELVGAWSGGNISPMLLTLGNTQYPFVGSPKRGALYTANGFPIFGDQCLPIGVAGGQIETLSNVFMPSSGWHCSLQQFRTYTFDEENESMRVTVGRNSKREATGQSIWDNDTEQFVGYVGNYPRYNTSKYGGLIAGKQTFLGYAAVGYYDGTDATIEADAGPCLVSYDTGSPGILSFTQTTGGPPPNPVSQGKVEFNIRTREDGAKLNEAIGPGPAPGDAALRRAEWAGWDNDRDQWLFCVSGPNEGVKIVSVDAPFTTFLDQSDAFSAASDPTWQTAKYFPISMSNALDGLVVFGERSRDDFGNIGMSPIYGPDVNAMVPWDPLNTYKVKSTISMKAYRITGSTGRTARVWIDYMLYDGVDAVIAMQLRDWGMRVTVENVEWFKARVLQEGDIKAKGEEIEEWMEQQGREYQDMLKEKERGGRLRKRRSQISAYKREVGDLMTPDQIDTQVYDFVPKGIAAQQRLKTSEGALKEVPPDSIEAMVERDYRSGFDTTPSGVIEPGDQLPEDPAKPAGTFMDTGDAPKKAPDEGGDPDEEYISEN